MADKNEEEVIDGSGFSLDDILALIKRATEKHGPEKATQIMDCFQDVYEVLDSVDETTREGALVMLGEIFDAAREEIESPSNILEGEQAIRDYRELCAQSYGEMPSDYQKGVLQGLDCALSFFPEQRFKAELSYAGLFAGRKRDSLTMIEDRLFEELLNAGQLRIRDGFIFIPATDQAARCVE